MRLSRGAAILFEVKILACDPGESFGYAVGEDNELQSAGTTEMWKFVHAFGTAALGTKDGTDDEELLSRLQGIERVVIEDWRLYPWELQSLAWNECRTARCIGAMEFICRTAEVPYLLQPASIKETAQAAGVEDLYMSPRHENRHANDALQHYVFFNLSQGGEPVRWAKEGAAVA